MPYSRDKQHYLSGSIDTFAVSLLCDLLATFPWYSCSRLFFCLGKFVVSQSVLIFSFPRHANVFSPAANFLQQIAPCLSLGTSIYFYLSGRMVTIDKDKVWPHLDGSILPGGTVVVQMPRGSGSKRFYFPCF